MEREEITTRVSISFACLPDVPSLTSPGGGRVIEPQAEGTHRKESPMTTAQFLYLILVIVAFGGFAAVLAVNSLRD